MRRFILMMVVASLMVAPAYADDMIRAIIGEAADQGLNGQIAIVCGIRNRFKWESGVYGAKMSRKPALSERLKAERALDMANPGVCWDLIQGADMWENVDAFGQPESWVGVPMVFVVKIGSHSFYRRLIEGE